MRGNQQISHKLFCFFVLLAGAFLLLQGCGVLFIKEEDLGRKRFQEHEEQYKPFRLQNTIAAYKEFIEKYPQNMFLESARSNIKNLQFAPYEQEDTIEGYMEFVLRYPGNPHVFKANTRIEQNEIKRYEKMDTIDGYREFLAKYPESVFAVLAKKRLQELEFRALDSTLQKNYGFDLLLYRLALKRLKKELSAGGAAGLADFTPFASVADFEGQKYFQTHLIYTQNPASSEPGAKEFSDKLFDKVISRMLIYLDNKFVNKKNIYGFSFDVGSSAQRFYGDRKVFREYYFPIQLVRLFAQKKLDGKSLVA